MASFKDCMRKAGLTKDVRAVGKTAYDRAYKAYAKEMGEELADKMATKKAFDEVDKEVRRLERNKLSQAEAIKRAKKTVRDYRGGKAPYAAAFGLFETPGFRGDLLKFGSVSSRIESVSRQAIAIATEGFAYTRPLKVGIDSGTERMKDVIYELAGRSTGNAQAAKAAESYKKMLDYLHGRFNAAGGKIPYRKDWVGFQSHDQATLRRDGLDKWTRYISPKLDWETIFEGVTPEVKEMQEFLRDAFVELTALREGKSGALSERRSLSRSLIFQDVEGWYEYQKLYGSGSPNEMIGQWMKGMARDIGRMEVLGPNPEATIKEIEELFKQSGDTGRRIRDLRNLDAYQAGELATPVNVGLARASTFVRHLNRATKLGGAVISALGDVFFARTARGMNGVIKHSRSLMPLGRVMAMMSSGGTEAQRFAAHMGLGAENWLAVNQGRFGDTQMLESLSSGSGRTADLVMRGTGLNAWTQANQWLHGLDQIHTLARWAGKSYGDMERLFRESLQRYGISEGEWKSLSGDMLDSFRGNKYMNVSRVHENNQVLGEKLYNMLVHESKFAVPVSSDRARAYALAGQEEGTVWGTAARHVLEFKSFPMSVTFFNLARAFDQSFGAHDRMYHMSQQLILVTLAGAVVLQAKSIQSGRDPHKLDDPRFWQAAMMQGGGFGLLGDFLFSWERNRHGMGIWGAPLGPTGSMIYDAFKQVAAPSGAGIVQYGQRHLTPGQNVWFARLLLERHFFDNLTQMVDPDAEKKFLARENWYKTTRGQRYWWKQGEGAPRREPDMSMGLQ